MKPRSHKSHGLDQRTCKRSSVVRKKKHHNWSFVVFRRTAQNTGKTRAEWWTVCLDEIPLKALPTVHLGPAPQPPDSFPPSSTTALVRLWLLIWLHLSSFWGFFFSLLVVFMRGLDPDLLSPLGIPQVWSNVGRLLLGKLIRNVPTKGEEEAEVGFSQLPGKHSASLFSYLYIPFLTSFCFQITPLH